MLLALGSAAGLAAFVTFQFRAANSMAVDAETLCPRGGPSAMAAILIDSTDQISRAQLRFLRQLIDAEVERSDVGTQFTFGVVSDDPARWGATPPLCKPPAATDVSQVNQNVRMVQARYEERFLAPMHATFERMTLTTDAKQSPIMEALQVLVAETPDFVTFGGEKRLIILSDLIQHSDAMSFYRGEDWQSFAGTPDADRLSETLSGAGVTLFILPRPHENIEASDAVEDFWARYLDTQGTRAPEVRRIGDL